MKKLMISALLLLVATTGMAQEGKGWFITPCVGLNVARLSGDADEYMKDKTGLSAGAKGYTKNSPDYFDFESFVSGIETPYVNPRVGENEDHKYPPNPIANQHNSSMDYIIPLMLSPFSSLLVLFYKNL